MALEFFPFDLIFPDVSGCREIPKESLALTLLIVQDDMVSKTRGLSFFSHDGFHGEGETSSVDERYFRDDVGQSILEFHVYALGQSKIEAYPAGAILPFLTF